MAWAILLVLLLLPTQGWGAIALDTSAQSTGGSGSSHTLNFTGTAGSVMVVSVATDNVATTSIDYNGATFEEIYDAINDGAGVSRLSCHIAVGAADGSSHVLTANLGAASGMVHIIVSSWTGVVTSSNAAAHRTVYSDGTGTGDLNVTAVDSQNGDVVVYALSNYGTNPSADQTNIITATGISGGAYDHLQQYANASGGNTAMTVTGGQFGQACATALIPDSGGGGPDVTHFYKRRPK